MGNVLAVIVPVAGLLPSVAPMAGLGYTVGRGCPGTRPGHTRG